MVSGRSKRRGHRRRRRVGRKKKTGSALLMNDARVWHSLPQSRRHKRRKRRVR